MGPALEVRPLRPDEAHLVVRYFHEATPADLDRMGVDPRRLPSAQAWTKTLEAALAAPPGSVPSFYWAWLVDGVPVGHASLKNLRPGDSADIHLHMWSLPHRGQGHGAALFCRSVLDAFDRFALHNLVCEPKASNPMPNRMLAKVGFPLVRTYEGASSELSQVATLNRYDLRRDVASAYLDGSSPRPWL